MKMKKRNADETCLCSYLKNKQHNLIFDIPKHIRVTNSLHNNSTIEISCDMSKFFKKNQILKNFVLKITNDPTTPNAFMGNSIGYHCFQFRIIKGIVLCENPLILFTNIFENILIKENFSNRFSMNDRQSQISFNDYASIQRGDIEITDYFFNKEQSNKFIKIYSHFLLDEGIGETLVFYLDPRNIGNIEIIERTGHLQPKNMIKFHTKLFNNAINYIEVKGFLNHKGVDWHGPFIDDS